MAKPEQKTKCTTVPTELIQTELHHVRTLKIMTRLFRTGMLEELQLEPGVVQGLFPCVDELSDIHTRFLSQLLERRRQALCPGSSRNFVIHRLGDLLISQVGEAGLLGNVHGGVTGAGVGSISCLQQNFS